jgi:hypothetical protein
MGGCNIKIAKQERSYKMRTKKIYYYTLESMDGRVYFGTSTKRLAKKHYAETSNEGICYKRLVGNNRYKKFMFMW